jgi:hypothetical protein
MLCACVHAGVPVSMMNSYIYIYIVKHTYILKIDLFKILDKVIRYNVYCPFPNKRLHIITNIRFGGVSLSY